VNSDYATLAQIELIKQSFVDGQVFYAYQEAAFYSLVVNLNTGTRQLIARSDFIARIG
jgi:hypothetical protein